MMRRFYPPGGGDAFWINDRNVVAVYGEANNVKIVTVATGGQSIWQCLGQVDNVARELNGYFDE